MALIHMAEISPTKPELIRSFVPAQSWAQGVDTSTLDPIGAFRFDDPAGDVGIETHLVRAADGTVLQIPLTYRGSPLSDDAEALITTMQHSVLGQRWIYDATHDPVYVTGLLHTMMTGGREAPQQVDDGGTLRDLPSTVEVRGSGNADVATPQEGTIVVTDEPGRTLIRVPGVAVELARVVRPGWTDTNPIRLTATWTEQQQPVVLAVLRSA